MTGEPSATGSLRVLHTCSWPNGEAMYQGRRLQQQEPRGKKRAHLANKAASQAAMERERSVVLGVSERGWLDDKSYMHATP